MTDRIQERYINPYTDFGFKKLFGTEMNKELLISFLNALLHDDVVITDISYLPTERFGAYGGRRAIFDVFCETESGEKIIVEMQKTEQAYFKDRSVFYASFPIEQQGQVGSEWDFKLNSVYTVGILNFVFDEDKDDKEYFHHKVMLMDTTKHTVFYNKLTFIYLEMPKFNKTEDELETMFDKWLFVLKNLSRLLDRPAALQERVFDRLFKQAEIARFTPKERMEYEDSIKVYRDLKNSMDTSFVKGVTQGIAQGIAEEKVTIATKMLRLGANIDFIMQATGLTKEEIEKLNPQ